MRSAYVSFSYHDLEAREYVESLRDQLQFWDLELIDLSMSIFLPDDIHRSITDAINKCSIFICFLDPKNANVMFELGYAYAKNKQIVIVSDDFKSIPRDVQNSAFVQRNSPPSKLMHQIEKQIQDLKTPSWHDELRTGSPVDQLNFLASRPEILDAIDSREFTAIISEWFRFHGCQVRIGPSGPATGYDFCVDGFRGGTAAVELKKYKSSSQVSISVVRQLVGAMLLENIHIGIIVSSAPFTRSAISFAKSIAPEVHLWTLDQMAAIRGITHEGLDVASSME